MAKELKNLTKRADNYSQWYNDLVVKADLAELSPVRGCMIIKPYGYAIWEKMQHELDKMFKKTGVQNAYFPLLIPKSFFSREAEHVQVSPRSVPWLLTIASRLLRMARAWTWIQLPSSMRSSLSALHQRPSSGTPIRTGFTHGATSLSSATSGAT